MSTFRRLAATVAVLGAGLLTVPGSALAIVGGTDAPAGKYPATANVTIAFAFGCTGTLIAPQWVLSAGHCSSLTGGAGVASPAAYPPQLIDVTLASNKADGTGGEDVTVDKVVLPPEYLLTSGHDISLLHLSAPARTTPVPIAGKGYGALWAPNVLEEIVGFGTTSSGGDAPDTLQQARVPIVSDASCAKVYPKSLTDGFEPETQLCAGYAQGGVDTCQGDSGGPMYGRTSDNRLFVVGSTSYGQGCADPGVPGVYARVADQTLREYIRGQAPGSVRDAAAGDVTTPAATYTP